MSDTKARERLSYLFISIHMCTFYGAYFKLKFMTQDQYAS